MNCTEVKNRLDEAANSADAVRLAADSAFRSHLDACPSCRREFVAAQRLFEFVARQKVAAAAVPDEELQATRFSILRAVAERQRRAPRGFLPVWLTDPLLASAPALAAFAVIVFGIVELRRSASDAADRVPVGSVSPAATTPHTASAVGLATETVAPSPAASKGKSPTAPRRPLATLPDLQAEFNRLKASQTGVTQEFVRQLLAHIDHGIESPEGRITAYQLLIDTYEQLGEARRALTAFSEMLDLVEERSGTDAATACVLRKAANVFVHDRDYLSGTEYYDMVLTRWPETEAAAFATLQTCSYFARIGQYNIAVQALRARVARNPDSRWTADLRLKTADYLFNEGRQDDACRELEGIIASRPEDPEFCAMVTYRLATLRSAMGMQSLPAAVRDYRTILTDYPRSRYASVARTQLSRLSDASLGLILD